MDENNRCKMPMTDDDSYLCCVQDVGDTVKRIVRNFALFERDRIKPLGFTMTQCYSLLEIMKSDKLTMQELSEKMNLNTSTMTRIVDKLVRDDYIERKRSENDRRIVTVELTDKGRDSAGELNESINSQYVNIIKNLPKGRVDEVLSAVSLLMEALEKTHPNCC